MPVRALDVVYLVLLGVTVAEVSQITGSLLVFALLALPPGDGTTADRRAPLAPSSPSVVLALVTVWLALGATFFSAVPGRVSG